MTDRRAFLVASVGVLAAPLVGEGQPGTKLPRIGVLVPGASPNDFYVEALREGLRELGWVDGRTIVFDYRVASGRTDRWDDFAFDLVRLNVNVIVVPTTSAGLAASRITKTIPIVMASAGRPVEAGLVGSLSRPGGNVTGVSVQISETNVKNLALVKELLPRMSRAAVLSVAGSAVMEQALGEVEAAASGAGVTVLPFRVKDVADFATLFRAAVQQHADAVLLLGNPLFFVHRNQLAELALEHRLTRGPSPTVDQTLMVRVREREQIECAGWFN